MTLPCSVAWETFNEANGAASLAQMRARILRYRKRIKTTEVISQSAVAFSLKRSSCTSTNGFQLQAAGRFTPKPLKPIQQTAKMGGSYGNGRDQSDWSVNGFSREQHRFGEPTLIRPRLGQGAFRVAVTDAYQRKCAVTGERTLPALDAAHIKPYGEGGEHEVSNGLLLRRDIHCLFDLGYVTVTPDHVFEVSPRIRAQFENGRDYYALQGKRLILPSQDLFRPEPAALDWHNEHRFLR